MAVEIARIPLLCVLAAMLISCGGGAPPPAETADKEASHHAVDDMTQPPPLVVKKHAVRLEEAEAAEALGPDAAKLLKLAVMSPKTHAALIKGYLWKATDECDAISLVPVAPAPGILVPEGEAPKLRAEIYARLKEAGAIATQRGTAIEVLTGHLSVGDAVKAWNRSALTAALAVAKAASPADRKNKSLMGAAKKRLDPDADPAGWGASVCTSGQLGGFTVVVQLVAINAKGARGAVLVKGGDDGERFEKETYLSTYWDKTKGKMNRMLTEIMSAGSFVRQCSSASSFTARRSNGSWRCREGEESWEPENRPIPAWQ